DLTYEEHSQPCPGQFFALLGGEPENKAKGGVSTEPEKDSRFSKRGRMLDHAHKYENQGSGHGAEQSHPEKKLRAWTKLHSVFKVYAPALEADRVESHGRQHRRIALTPRYRLELLCSLRKQWPKKKKTLCGFKKAGG